MNKHLEIELEIEGVMYTFFIIVHDFVHQPPSYSYFAPSDYDYWGYTNCDWECECVQWDDMSVEADTDHNLSAIEVVFNEDAERVTSLLNNEVIEEMLDSLSERD